MFSFATAAEKRKSNIFGDSVFPWLIVSEKLKLSNVFKIVVKAAYHLTNISITVSSALLYSYVLDNSAQGLSFDNTASFSTQSMTKY